MTIKGVGVPVDFELYARQGFPLQVHKKQLSICQDTVFTIPVPSSIYELTYIKIGDESFMNIYTIPGDTLKISLDLDIELAREDRISFDGYTSGICLYFEEKRKNWIETKGYDYYYDSTISLQSFTDKMDRNRENDLEFLAEYKSQNRLPGWFIETEKNNIIYETAGSKMSIIKYGCEDI